MALQKQEDFETTQTSFRKESNIGLGTAAVICAVSSIMTIKAEPPEIFSAQTDNIVGESSKYDILFDSIVKQPLPRLGMIFAKADGQWHVIKEAKGEILGKSYSITLPATGKTAEIKNMPIKVEINGSDLGVYSWQKGEIDPTTGLPKVIVTIDPDKIAYDVSFLEESYNLTSNNDKQEESYIAVVGEPDNRILRNLKESPGNAAQAICNGAGKLITGKTPDFCQPLEKVSQDEAIDDYKIEASAKLATINAVRQCSAIVWEQQKEVIKSAVREIIGSQLQYPEEYWDSLVTVNFKSQQQPDYTFSTLDNLVKRGALTEATLKQQNYNIYNTINVNCITDEKLTVNGAEQNTAPEVTGVR